MRITLFYILLCLLASCSAFRPQSNLELAEELGRQGRYEDAIEAYRRHMNERLKEPKRPDWENPYFYLILIGDIQLGQGNPKEALQSFTDANAKGVDDYLVSDRLRAVANWYEQNGQLREALAILEEHRTRDPLLFDIMLDRIARRLSAEEDAAREAAEAASPHQ